MSACDVYSCNTGLSDRPSILCPCVCLPAEENQGGMGGGAEEGAGGEGAQTAAETRQRGETYSRTLKKKNTDISSSSKTNEAFQMTMHNW